MKKIICYIAVIFSILPLFVTAGEVDYKITSYYTLAEILENGDVSVTELIVMDGTFNGYVREIKYQNEKLKNEQYKRNEIYNASGVELKSVAAKKVDQVHFNTMQDSDFTILKANQPSNLGYTISPISNGQSYKMYFKSQNEKVAFKIQYILKDVVVLHQDVAELYWNFLGEEYEDTLKDVRIEVQLPSTDNSDKFRVWAHGDLTGEIHKKGNNGLVATIKQLEPHNTMDIRTTFNPALINSSLISKKTLENSFGNILNIEENRAEEANHQRQAMKKTLNTFYALSGIYTIALVVAWIYVYLKYDKEYKSTFHEQYYREFSDEYNVEVIDYLFHKSITENAMSASILNLIYKKNIKIEEIPGEQKKKEYTFILENTDNVTESETILIDFLFSKVGSNNQFTTTELKKYASDITTCESFSSNYTIWKNKVITEGRQRQFFENNNQAKGIGIGIAFLFLGCTIGITSSMMNIENFFINVSSIFLGIIFFIYTLAFFRRSKYGNEEYAKWKAFKNFLNDFGTFELKELPEIKLWDRYMVYATIFGLASKVSKTMNVRIKELEASGVYVNTSPAFSDWYIYNAINNSVNHTIQENRTAITNARANSSSSSGSGFGGGFSSGGGFGGGGGGGHGF